MSAEGRPRTRQDSYVAKDALVSVHDRGNETTLPDFSCNCQSSLPKAENAGAIVAVFCVAILSARIFAGMENFGARLGMMNAWSRSSRSLSKILADAASSPFYYSAPRRSVRAKNHTTRMIPEHR
jgi:hypothetical protein